MKDWLEKERPENGTQDQLRQWVMEAWNAVPEDFLLTLIESMPKRMLHVHLTGGGHTRF